MQNKNSNIKNKLTLKKFNSDSATLSLDLITIHKENEKKLDSELEINKSPIKTGAEDSLEDFKSDDEKPHKSILSKFKVDVEKPKKKILSSKAKSKAKNVSKQPSIESSFFKVQHLQQSDLKESFPCPICLKPFKDDSTCTNHMKSCAARNKVSIQDLINAKNLQDRQVEERKCLGLPGAPLLQEKRKKFHSKQFSTGDDAQYQLALALSESAYEAEKLQEFEQAALLAGIPSDCIKHINDEERNITLQNFGFTTNKDPSQAPVNKSKKKKLLCPTILQTRSNEDKDRVLTERIACILTGDDALTQTCQLVSGAAEEITSKFLKSHFLKKIEKTDQRLWDQSRLTKKLTDFHSNELKIHFLQPSTIKETDLDSKLSYLHENYQNELNLSLNSSVLYEPIETDIIAGVTDQNECDSIPSVIKKDITMDFTETVLSNWSAAINDSSNSDVIIYVKESKRIYAHSLVFHIQCSNLLLDMVQNTDETIPWMKHSISWPDKDPTPVLAFLEFIYCGYIKKFDALFNEPTLVQQVQHLAAIYKVENLFSYLRKKMQNVSFKAEEKQKENHFHFESNDSNAAVIIRNQVNLNSESFNVSADNNAMKKSKSEPIPFVYKHENEASSLSFCNLDEKRMTASPELFDSEHEDESIYTCKTPDRKTNENCNTNKNCRKEYQDECHSSDSQNTIIDVSCAQARTDNETKENNEVEGDNNEVQFILKQQVDEASEETFFSCDTHQSPYEKDFNESIYDAKTPPPEDLGKFHLQGETVKKLRTDISLFIERVKRNNAKGILESDSEDSEADAKVVKKIKNPFLKKNRNDTYEYLQKQDKKKMNDRKVISLLEIDIVEKIKSSKEEKSNESLNQGVSETSSQYKTKNCVQADIEVHSVSDDDAENATVNESAMSMYERYTKTHQKDNSIEKYRKQLIFDSGEELKQTEAKINNQVKNKTSTVEKKKVIDDITLVSDSDDDEKNKNSYKSELKEFSEYINMSKSEEASCSKIQSTGWINKNDGKEHLSSSSRSEKSQKSAKPKIISSTILLDPLKITSTSKRIVKRSEHTVKINFSEIDSADAEISKILPNSPEISKINAVFQDQDDSDFHIKQSQNQVVSTESSSNQKKDNEPEIINLSPITISSSPDNLISDGACLKNATFQKSQQNISANASKNETIPTVDLIDNLFLDDIDFSEKWSTKSQIEKKENSHQNGTFPKELHKSSRDARVEALISSPILSQGLHSNARKRVKRKSESPESKLKKTKKFKTKATSLSNIQNEPLERNSCLPRSMSHATPEKSDLSFKAKEQEASTPCLDYSRLETPELHKELFKYGVRPLKREKAKLLLRHIYNETHGEISQEKILKSKDKITENEDIEKSEEPESKKSVPIKKSSSEAKELNRIPTKKTNINEVDNIKPVDKPVSIRDAFNSLLKENVKIHNQLLRYEPVILETVHSKLKEKGYKFKVDVLMDFLDEQCITYRVENEKERCSKKKKT